MFVRNEVVHQVKARSPHARQDQTAWQDRQDKNRDYVTTLG